MFVRPVSVARLFSVFVCPVSVARLFCLSVRPVSVVRLFCVSVRPVSVARLFCLFVCPFCVSLSGDSSVQFRWISMSSENPYALQFKMVYVRLEKPIRASVQGSMYALGKVHTRSTPSLRRLCKVAFETVPMEDRLKHTCVQARSLDLINTRFSTKR